MKKISRSCLVSLLLAGALPLAAQVPAQAPAQTPALAQATPPVQAAPSQFRLISQDALLERERAAKDEPLVLDVRTAQEYAAGHVPGAINLPHDQVAARIAEIDGARDRDVIVYCRSGRRSELALGTLRAQGFGKLWHLEGDYLAWEAAERPVERAPGAAAPAPVEAQPRETSRQYN